MLLGVVGAFCGVAPAHAAEPSVGITLTGVSPATVDAKGTITITGTVRNTSSVAMSWVQASFWRSRDPISDTDSLGSLAVSPPTVPVGERWFHEPGGRSIANITDPDGTTVFKPGEKANFTVSGTASAMGLTSTDAAYLIGVHIQATPAGHSRMTVGRARAFTVVSGASTKARLAPVITLSSAPSVRLDGTFTDDHLAEEFTGRLDRLIDEAASRRSTVLVDPALVDEATAMAAGYTVNGITGTGTGAARAWLAKLTPLLTSGRIYRLPYGDADVVAAARTGHSTVISRSVKALDVKNPARSLPLAVTDEAGALDRPSLNLITTMLKPSLVLTAAAPAGPAHRQNGATVIGLSHSLLAGGPDHQTSAGQLRGRLLAQTLLMSRENLPAVTLVGDTAQLDATAPLGTSTSWLTLTDLGSAIASATATTAPLPAHSSTATALTGDWWTTQITAASDAADWGNVLGNGAVAELQTARILSRSLSLSLAADRRSAWLRDAMAPATDLLGGSGVQLHSAASFVMSSSSNDFPLTVTNNLTETVKVKVTFTSANPQRIGIPDTSVVTIRPKESQTIRFAPRASSNGIVEMTAQLTTPSGRELGPSTTFVIRATRMDDIGWIIIIVSGAVVLGATLLRVRQVRRRNGGTGDGITGKAGAATGEAGVTGEADDGADRDPS
ncbi:hypothetical protein JS278_00156 [Acidipropionibacterium virtanenii]|uniref:Glycoprotein n=2 Tax=Acidipropionibacterium virtanenii TaxID=2057246 RepID=A0A344UQ05_9ACTN|nr:hypothetical protein JS278_00156 [Acidipropionibacterium virtanenii]